MALTRFSPAFLASVLLITTSCASSSAVAGSGGCASSKEKAALDARVLQSELMVGALACGQQASYNKLVVKYRPQLAENGENLRSYFSRVYGGRGTTETDKFVTKLANEASERSRSSGNFCSHVNALFDRMLSGSDEIMSLAAGREFADRHNVKACPAYTMAN